MLGYDWPRLHAALNDLPIGLLLAAVLFDLLAITMKRESFRQVSFWTLILGAIGGVVAVVSGLQAEEHIAHGEAVHRVMETHELLGLVTLGVFGVLALWRIVRERRMRGAERSITVLLSIIGAGFVFATGFYGGKLVFDHAAGIPTPVLQAEMLERATNHHHGGAAEQDTSTTGSDHVDAPATAPHSHAPGTPPHKD